MLLFLNDRILRFYLLGLIFAYGLCGFYGTLAYSDEFDNIRTPLVAFFSAPIYMGFLSFILLTESWWLRRPKLALCLVAGIFLGFFWSQLLIMNALSGQSLAIVDIEYKELPLDIAFKRGGFGWLYRERF